LNVIVIILTRTLNFEQGLTGAFAFTVTLLDKRLPRT